MKKFFILILLILSITSVVTGCTVIKKYEDKTDISTIKLDKIDTYKLTYLTNEFITNKTGNPSTYTLDKVIKVEFYPNNQLKILELLNSNDNYCYAICTITYSDENKSINDILSNHEDFALQIYVKYIDIDSSLILNYYGFDSGYITILSIGRNVIDNEYLYSYNIAIYSNGYCYDYILSFTSASIISASNMPSTLTSIFETGVYGDESVISITNTPSKYMLLDDVYVMNY